MKQITKFYLTSFLKNQTYFTPVLVIFMQAMALSLQEVFWVFTIGSIASFILELPTGVIADLMGKKKTVVFSKILIFCSFIVFGFAADFWWFVLAQVIFEMGQSFRSGTETAFVYDYLRQAKGVPTYTRVKGGQKFWARLSEAGATAVGGLIAVQFGYSWVFFLAAIPAFFNILLAVSWEPIRESEKRTITLKESFRHVKASVCQVCEKRILMRMTLNIMLFTAALATVDKFLQPYMGRAGIPVAYFGFIYAAALIITSLAVKYSYLLEDRFGKARTINWLSLLAAVPVAVVGFRFVSIYGVILLFLVVIIENFRSPVANAAFHDHVVSRQRATLGSTLSLAKNLGKIVILPIMGWVVDAYSLFTALLLVAGLLLLNGLLFRLPLKKRLPVRTA